VVLAVRAAGSVSVVRILDKTFGLQNHSGDGAFCALPVSGMASPHCAAFLWCDSMLRAR